MGGSGTIRVVKRDGRAEPFEPAKLAGSIGRAMRETVHRPSDARELALAIGLYLARSGWGCVSSAALFEMTVKVLRRAGLAEAADVLEADRRRRRAARDRLRVRHGGGKVTLWDKSWLGELAERGWLLSRSTARILAGEVERELLAGGAREVSRRDVLARLNAMVAAYGLAGSVPASLPDEGS